MIGLMVVERLEHMWEASVYGHNHGTFPVAFKIILGNQHLCQIRQHSFLPRNECVSSQEHFSDSGTNQRLILDFETNLSPDSPACIFSSFLKTKSPPCISVSATGLLH